MDSVDLLLIYSDQKYGGKKIAMDAIAYFQDYNSTNLLYFCGEFRSAYSSLLVRRLTLLSRYNFTSDWQCLPYSTVKVLTIDNFNKTTT